MAVSTGTPPTITGIVASVNPKGVRLEGETDWRNFSKFAPDIAPPMRGQTVTLTIDRAGFVRSVQDAEGGPEAVPGTNGRSGAAPGQPGGISGADRDRTITRLAVLKAAAEFAAARPPLKSGEVLKIAEAWERWVLRDTEPSEDLTDAF